jgi:Ca2+-binding EF-hand superfamily protein
MGSGVAIPKERVVDRKLSDETHFKDGMHNPDYDHEAFLGEEEAKEFQDLTPEQSRERLGKLFDRIDENSDGIIDKQELQMWIKHTQHRYIDEDVNRQWKSHNPDNADTISWDQYKKVSFGFLDGMSEDELKGNDGQTYSEMLRRDKRRWDKADSDGDGSLTKAEFTDFLHPEESPKLQEIVVAETMEDIDKDKDGKVTLEEYIGDLYHGAPGEQEPDWVSQERDQFKEFRDKNGDGYLDEEEVKAWIMPPDYDHSEAEADHLIHEADTDSDRKLTKEEVLLNYDLFVGSQATDFGEYLNRHDEF